MGWFPQPSPLPPYKGPPPKPDPMKGDPPTGGYKDYVPLKWGPIDPEAATAPQGSVPNRAKKKKKKKKLEGVQLRKRGK